jgi:hypothetical protein
VATDARHGGPLAAANLLGSGELYGYALRLVLHLQQYPGGLKQLHIDIMCKWKPWSAGVINRVLAAENSTDPVIRELRQLLQADGGAMAQALQSMRKVNAAAHGNLHAQDCQVLVFASVCQPVFSRVVSDLCAVLQILNQPSWNTGCALTKGEEGEALFSFLSRLAGRTRNMNDAGKH